MIEWFGKYYVIYEDLSECRNTVLLKGIPWIYLGVFLSHIEYCFSRWEPMLLIWEHVLRNSLPMRWNVQQLRPQKCDAFKKNMLANSQQLFWIFLPVQFEQHLYKLFLLLVSSFTQVLFNTKALLTLRSSI